MRINVARMWNFFAVSELFSLGILAGRNCTGRSSTGSREKQLLDRINSSSFKIRLFKFTQSAAMATEQIHGED